MLDDPCYGLGSFDSNLDICLNVDMDAITTVKTVETRKNRKEEVRHYAVISENIREYPSAPIISKNQVDILEIPISEDEYTAWIIKWRDQDLLHEGDRYKEFYMLKY